MTEIASGEKNITIAILGEDLPYSVYHKNISFEMVVEPKATVIVTDEDMMVTLSYNVQYNLTVLGSLCGHTSSVNFSYGEQWIDDHYNNDLAWGIILQYLTPLVIHTTLCH